MKTIVAICPNMSKRTSWTSNWSPFQFVFNIWDEIIHLKMKSEAQICFYCYHTKIHSLFDGRFLYMSRFYQDWIGSNQTSGNSQCPVLIAWHTNLPDRLYQAKNWNWLSSNVSFFTQFKNNLSHFEKSISLNKNAYFPKTWLTFSISASVLPSCFQSIECKVDSKEFQFNELRDEDSGFPPPLI